MSTFLELPTELRQMILKQLLLKQYRYSLSKLINENMYPASKALNALSAQYPSSYILPWYMDATYYISTNPGEIWSDMPTCYTALLSICRGNLVAMTLAIEDVVRVQEIQVMELKKRLGQLKGLARLGSGSFHEQKLCENELVFVEGMVGRERRLLNFIG